MFSNSKNIVISGSPTFNSYQNPSSNQIDEGLKILYEHAAPDALHDSGKRSPPPKCHPGTRVHLCAEIMSWLDDVNSTFPVMWMNGPKGSGKSSIAQTIAELCHERGQLLGSFFFASASSTRNNQTRLVATLAYQMSKEKPQTRPYISSALFHDPLIFESSLRSQIETLIIHPYYFHVSQAHPSKPRLIVIDGLNECINTDSDAQALIAKSFVSAIAAHQHKLANSLKILIISRPETNIETAFSDPDLSIFVNCLSLDDSWRPADDIRIFIVDSLKDITRSHPSRLSLPADWLQNIDIEKLVEKSSGQFLYAAKAIQMIRSNDNPASSFRKLIHQERTIISQMFPVPTVSPAACDIVAFGVHGVVMIRTGDKSLACLSVPDFGLEAGGWRKDRHVRLVADTTGSGRADIVGFGDNGVWISVNNGDNTFQAPREVLSDFSCSAGWKTEMHLRFMADMDNSGRADIVGFGNAGVIISQNNGGGSFGPARLVLSDFGCLQGWSIAKHLRFLADMDGNGLLDVVGFGEKQVAISRNNGDGSFQPAKACLSDLCYGAGGWRVDKHLRFLADLTGDGKPDLIGFGGSGVYVAFNNGDGSFQSVRKVINDFCFQKGWRVDKHPRFIADITGNRCGDIVGFHDAGVYVAINNGNGTFQPVRFVGGILSYNQGWRVGKHPRFMADMTGDGRADIVGFGKRAVLVSYNDGRGNFGPVVELISGFGSDDSEWLEEHSVKYVANLYA